MANPRRRQCRPLGGEGGAVAVRRRAGATLGGSGEESRVAADVEKGEGKKEKEKAREGQVSDQLDGERRKRVVRGEKCRRKWNG